MALSTLSCTTDLSDAEWGLLAPLPPRQARGRPPEWPLRRIVNGILDVVYTGCPWRLVPREFPPWQTVSHSFRLWRLDGTWERLNANRCDRGCQRRVARCTHPLASSTASRSRRPASVVSAATMEPRSSASASTISSSTSWGWCCGRGCMPPTSRIGRPFLPLVLEGADREFPQLAQLGDTGSGKDGTRRSWAGPWRLSSIRGGMAPHPRVG